ncbi:MAG: hypothetical protein U0793_04335 [Gemmataceae bacterium]
MTTVRATFIGDQAIVPRTELDRLIMLARQVEQVDVRSADDDLSALAMTLVAKQGGAFDWLADEPDLYSLEDIKVRYR